MFLSQCGFRRPLPATAVGGCKRRYNHTMPSAQPSPEASPKRVRLSRTRRAAILKALADPRRFELLERLAKSSCPLGCAQMRAALPISAATLSHHIKELETAGLIAVRREGKFHYLSLRPGVLAAVAQTLSELDPGSCSALLPA